MRKIEGTEYRPRREQEVQTIFKSVAVIGAAGQTGQLYVESMIEKHVNEQQGIRVEAVVREKQRDMFAERFAGTVDVSSHIEEALARKPEAAILATANPIEETVAEIAEHAKGELTLILPQNGVEAVATARKVLKEKKKENIQLVRASLFTTVSRKEDGTALYDPEKKRVALAPVFEDDTVVFSGKKQEILKKTAILFQNSGFEVKVFDDYLPMEGTKLIANGIGSTGPATGKGPKETFLDEQLSTLEIKALKDRLRIMKEAGRPFAHIPWQSISLLPAAEYIPEFVLKSSRRMIAEKIAKERNNELPAAARKIEKHQQSEAAEYYHRPFIDLAKLHGLRSPVDEAIRAVLTDHEKGKIDLPTLFSEDRKKLLLEKYNKKLQEGYTPRDPASTAWVERLTEFFTKEAAVTGSEHLQSAQEYIANGKSVIIFANHLSHADHPTLVRAMRKSGYNDLADRLVFIAGTQVQNESVGKVFNRAYPTITVSTPTLKPLNEEERQRSEAVNKKGMRDTAQLLKEGNILVIYPEGTRSKTGRLQKAISQVAGFIDTRRLNVAAVIPVGIAGTEKLLPRGETLPRRAKTQVAFGEPMAAEEILDDAKKLPPHEQHAYIIDGVMKWIAQLLSEEYRGYYSS